MGLHNANILDDLAEEGLLFTRKWLEDALYLIVAIMSWLGSKKQAVTLGK